MNTWFDVSEIPQDLAETAVTIGKFDAIHLGHQALLAELLDVAEDAMLAPVVLSFANHPNSVLNPENVPLPVIGPNQRAYLLEEAGVEGVLSLAFDSELAALSPENFVSRYLVNALKAKAVIVGQGFRFGAGGAGTVETLRDLGAKHGFTVREVAPVCSMARRFQPRWFETPWMLVTSFWPAKCSVATTPPWATSNTGSKSVAKSGFQPRTWSARPKVICRSMVFMRAGYMPAPSATQPRFR